MVSRIFTFILVVFALMVLCVVGVFTLFAWQIVSEIAELQGSRYTTRFGVVKWGKERVHDVDAATFKVLETDHARHWARDQFAGFSAGERIEGSDGSTFEVINGGWAKDKQFVYCRNTKWVRNTCGYPGIEENTELDHRILKSARVTIFNDIDPYTIRVVQSTAQSTRDSYVVDEKHVYHGLHRIPIADPKTFRHLDDDYYRDDQYVYALGRRLETLVDGKRVPANPEEFREMENAMHYFTDGVGVFHRGIAMPEADPATFETVNYRYDKDAYRVYCYYNIIQDVDASSFRVNDEEKCLEDAYGKFDHPPSKFRCDNIMRRMPDGSILILP